MPRRERKGPERDRKVGTGVRLGIAILAVGVTLCSAASGTAPEGAPRFRWTAGLVLTYQLRQRTTVQETFVDERQQKQTRQTTSDLQLTREWTVQAVDAMGVATLQMRILSLRSELRRGEEEPLIRDSAQPEHAKEMAAFLNKGLVTVRLDGRGRLLAVTEVRSGSAQRLEVELPFRLVLPEEGWEAGRSWQRQARVKIDPPLGVGDSYTLEQKYTLLRRQGNLWTVGLSTRWTEEPPLAEQAAVFPFLWEGEVDFDAAAGQYQGARLRIERELRDHLGPGSRYVYRSSYEEQRLPR